MIKIEFNGAFGLIEIKRIMLIKNRYHNNLYVIYFKNDDSKLMTTDFNCFLTDNEQPIRTCDLKPGDKIWVDTTDLYGKQI